MDEDSYFPAGYQETEEGLFFLDVEGNLYPLTTTHLRAISMVRSATGSRWALELQVTDRDGVSHPLTVQTSELVCGGSAVVKQLADNGLGILPGAEKDIVSYLIRCEPPLRKILVSHSGWLENNNIFVLPEEVVGDNEEEIIYSPPEGFSSQKGIRAGGALDDWLSKVARKATGNFLIAFCLMVAFYGPLLRLLRLDGGGFHLWGPSSRGKTTLLQVAASVWGDGSDPSSPGTNSMVRRWNMTQNAIEAIAAGQNDMVTPLDELGTFMGSDFGAAVYAVTSGEGKAALTSTRKLQNIRTYRGNVISCGEISVEAKIREGGKRAMTGQLLRMIDIPVGENIFIETGDQSAGEFAVDLKKACARDFGHAGPAFVAQMIDELNEDRDGFIQILNDNLELFADELTPAGMHPEQARVMRRLAAVRLAGELAVEFGLLPLADSDVSKTLEFVRDLWLQGQNTIADSDRAIRTLKAFITKNHSSFVCVTDPNARVTNAKGFYSPTRDAYFFNDEQLEAATRGYDPKTLAKELRSRSLLLTEEGGRLKVGQKIAAMQERRLRLYAVRARLLEESLGEDDANS